MTAQTHAREARALRARLDHPVVDGDGHILEFLPLFFDYFKQVGGGDLYTRYMSRGKVSDRYSSPAEREERRLSRSPYWTMPAKNTLDRMTATLPALLRERLDEFGIDFTVLYPTLGLNLYNEPDQEFRQALCRAYNTMVADHYREHSDRMTPVAIIPAFTPKEAIDELDHAIRTLGLKAMTLGTMVRRPIEAARKISPEAARYAVWFDNLALDSAYDYDPFWAKCVELKVSVASHVDAIGRGFRTSTSNYTYSQVGCFAEVGEAFCKAVVLGGVARRFPRLNFAFLEGGAGWACDLFRGLDSRLKKRSGEALDNYNPARLNQKLAEELVDRYGGRLLAGKFPLARLQEFNVMAPTISLDGISREHPDTVDEWQLSGIRKREELIDVFARQFYFGCEADDPTASLAFRGTGTPRSTPLRAIFSSDLGHWDVVDMREIMSEAFELLDDGALDESQFRQFMFAYPVAQHATMNPDFFRGTIVEDAVEKEMKVALAA